MYDKELCAFELSLHARVGPLTKMGMSARQRRLGLHPHHVLEVSRVLLLASGLEPLHDQPISLLHLRWLICGVRVVTT